MSEHGGGSLGRQYDAATEHHQQDERAPAATLGALYSHSRTDESSLDLFSGTVILEPRLVDTRSARAVRQAAGSSTPSLLPASSDLSAPSGGQDAQPGPSVSPTAAKDGSDAQVARSSVIMAAGTLVSRGLGLVRQVMLIAAVGAVSPIGRPKGQANAGNIWDTANTLPNMVFLLLAGGVFNAVLIPQLTRALKDPDGGKAFTDRLVTLALLILGGITLTCVVFAYPLYRVYDLSGNSEALHLGWLFSLICLPQILFYGVYTVFGEVLNSRSKFGAFMWSPALANVASISGLLYFLAHFAPNTAPGNWTTSMVLVLAGSATLGVMAQALVLILPLRRIGYRYHPNMHFRGVGLRSTSKIAVLAFAAILIQQGGLVVTTNVLMRVPGQYGGRLVQSTAFLLFMLPHSLITVSLITALYTRISTAAHERDTKRVTDDVATAVRLCGVAVIPVTIGAFALIPPIAVLLGHSYGPTAISAFSTATIAMMLGSFPLALNVIVQRTLYAYEDAKKPLLMQVWGTAVVVPLTLLCLLLPYKWVGAGVALVQSISYCAQAGAGYYWLSRRLGGLPMPGVARTYGRLAVAAGAATVAAFAARWVVGSMISGERAAALSGLSVGFIAFLATYLIVARLLRVGEIEALLAPVTSRLGRLSGGRA